MHFFITGILGLNLNCKKMSCPSQLALSKSIFCRLRSSGSWRPGSSWSTSSWWLKCWTSLLPGEFFSAWTIAKLKSLKPRTVWDVYIFTIQVQAQDSRDQEMHRHPDREGVPGEAGRSEGHLQLPRLGPDGDQEGEAFVFDNLSQYLIWLAFIAKNVHSVLAKLATFTALWKASPIVIITLYWGHLVQSLTHFTSPAKVPRAPGFQVGQTPGLKIPWWGHHCHQTATVLERINCVLEKPYDLFDITAAFTVRYKFKSVAGTLCSQIAPRLLLSIRPSQRRCRRFQPVAVAHFYQLVLMDFGYSLPGKNLEVGMEPLQWLLGRTLLGR